MAATPFSEIFDYADSMIGSADVNWLNSVVKLALSALLGSVIGYERKSKGQNAGVCTFSLIPAGATLAMILSIYIPQEYLGLKNGDPGRIAAQVITGIGFLGAGTIIHMKGSIKGLTTAAGIWMMAMIGMAVGAGLYLIGIVSTILMLVIFIYFAGYEQHVNIGWNNKMIKLECDGLDFDSKQIEAIFSNQKIRIVDTFMKQDFASSATIVSYIVQMKADTDLLLLFKELNKIANVKAATLDSDFSI